MIQDGNTSYPPIDVTLLVTEHQCTYCAIRALLENICYNLLIGCEAAETGAMSHIVTILPRGTMFPVVFTLFVAGVSGFCGDSIRWSHHVNMDDVYGVWYGVGYAQHTPDMTNKPNEVGCVTLYISDATTEGRDDWLDWSVSISFHSSMC